jgi:hypothetical protein
VTQIVIKRGATFTATGTYTPAAGALPNLIGATLTSQVRARGFSRDLEVTLAPDGLTFTVDGGPTSDWPVGVAEWDMRIEVGSEVIYTDTVRIQVQRPVTS